MPLSLKQRTLVIAISSGLISSTAWADERTLFSSGDATIYSQNDSGNSNGAGPGMFAGTDGNGHVLRSLLRFDIAGVVPAGSTITSAQLTLHVGMVAGGSGASTVTIDLHRILNGWGEGTTGSTATTISGTGQGFPAGEGDSTWNDRFYATTSPMLWTTPGGDFSSSTSGSTNIGSILDAESIWASGLELISNVQGWLDDPSHNDGWILMNGDELHARTFRAFYTREAANPAFRPQLQISYVIAPEPTALMPAALVGLLLRRRRRVVPDQQ
jgi:hypothetical protein